MKIIFDISVTISINNEYCRDIAVFEYIYNLSFYYSAHKAQRYSTCMYTRGFSWGGSEITKGDEIN